MRRLVTVTMCAIAAAFEVAASPARAGTLEVAPTTVVLGQDAKAGVLYVNNDGNAPVTVQIEPFDWAQSDGKEQLTPSDALMVSPPIAAIPAQAKQTIRLMTKPGTGAAERTFRLLVSELPDPALQTRHTVQVLTQFSVPVFTDDAATGPANVVWDAVLESGALKITARNDGARHAKFADLQIVTPASAKPLPGSALNYILAGSSRHWNAPCTGCEIGQVIHVEGRDEASDAKLDESLVIGR